MNSFAIYSFMAIVACFGMTQGYEPLTMEIKPDTHIVATENVVTIRCRPDPAIKEITVLEISKTDENPIAYLRQCNNISHGSGFSTHFKAWGYINKESNENHLSLNVSNPLSVDGGSYSCVMYYLDGDGNVKVAVDNKTLKIKKLTGKALETVVRQLNLEITTLKLENKKQRDELKKQRELLDRIMLIEESKAPIDLESSGDSAAMSDLETKMNVMEQKFMEVKEKALVSSAFSATIFHSFLTTSGSQVLVLPDVTMNHGKNYDQEYGVYTAPKAGLYVFHLSVYQKEDCTLNMDIRVNEKSVASMGGYLKGEYEQTTQTCVTDLRDGDRVTVYSRNLPSHGCMLYDRKYCQFSGYLLRAY